MIYVVIALGVVFALWIVSVVIQKGERKRREELIKMRQEERRKEEEAREKANRPRFYS